MADFVVKPLGFPWVTADPFLFCVHHNDHYPRGDARLAPVASLAGREIGADFSGKDGWSMYHGDVVPGFPAHPHRGFETVTIARRGYIDHSDSLGATARFGKGDVQWLTAGKGVVHCEMFPLLEREQDNPVELFQIWLNLPRKAKMATPHFTMLWGDTIPRRTITDAAGRTSELVLVAGDPASPPPPPASWAADPTSGVAIWTLAMSPGATVTLPAGPAGARRSLYFFAGTAVPPKRGMFWDGAPAVTITNGDAPAELLMLQGRPIGEPVGRPRRRRLGARRSGRYGAVMKRAPARPLDRVDLASIPLFVVTMLAEHAVLVVEDDGADADADEGRDEVAAVGHHRHDRRDAEFVGGDLLLDARMIGAHILHQEAGGAAQRQPEREVVDHEVGQAAGELQGAAWAVHEDRGAEGEARHQGATRPGSAGGGRLGGVHRQGQRGRQREHERQGTTHAADSIPRSGGTGLARLST